MSAVKLQASGSAVRNFLQASDRSAVSEAFKKAELYRSDYGRGADGSQASNYFVVTALMCKIH